MRKIKTVTHHAPDFLKTAYKHDHLLELVNHERFIPIGERYITFERGVWSVHKLDEYRYPRLCGRHKIMHLAVHQARLKD
jgi:hypothetical protein